MIETIFVFGLAIFAGVALILAKLPLRWSLRILGWHIWFDVIVTVLVLWIHWGTMVGLLSASIAGLVCSLCTSSARWTWGYIQGGQYSPGQLFDLRERLGDPNGQGRECKSAGAAKQVQGSKT